MQLWFKKSYKDESLEDEKHSGQPLEVDSNKLRAITEAGPLTTTKNVAQELITDHSVVIWHLKQLEREKAQ